MVSPAFICKKLMSKKGEWAWWGLRVLTYKILSMD